MALDPTLSNAQAQLDAERTGIVADYFARDQRWANPRLAPVFGTARRRARIRRFTALDALPRSGSRTLAASGGQGTEFGIQAATPVEFLINDGNLSSRVLDQEVEDAIAEGNPDEPWNLRAIHAAGMLALEAEESIIPYYKPGGANFPAGNIIAPSGNWATSNPKDKIMSADIRRLVAAFDLQFGTKPNLSLLDTASDEFFLPKLMDERRTSITLGSFEQQGDVLPSADGMRLADTTLIIPGARKENSPLDSTYTPVRAWGDMPYFVVTFSPTPNGGDWSKAGDCYVAQAEYRRPGTTPYATYRQRDTDQRNKWTNMWWEFQRTLQVVKADMVMAIGPIRAAA